MVIRTLEWQNLKRADYLDEDLEDIFTEDVEKNLSKYQEISYKIYKQKWVWQTSPRYLGKFWTYYVNNIPGFNAEYVTFTRNEMKAFIALHKIPLCTATKLTSSGHIIVTVGFNNMGFYANDPYGDATTKYRNHNGKEVYYPDGLYKDKIESVVIWPE